MKQISSAARPQAHQKHGQHHNENMVIDATELNTCIPTATYSAVTMSGARNCLAVTHKVQSRWITPS
jgi:hypothetical protein